MTERENEHITYPIADLDEPEEREDVEGNSEDEDEAVETVAKWWDIDYEAKQGIQDEFEQIHLLYTGEHWALKYPADDPIREGAEMLGRPNSVENICFAMIEGEKAEFAQDFEWIDSPAEKNDESAAQKMTNLKKFILYKNRINREQAKFLHNFFWLGTGVYGPRWDSEWISGQGPRRTIGDIRVEALHPQVLYPDARCGDDINNGFRIHKALFRPIEYIRQNYPERGHLVREAQQQGADMLGISGTTEGGERWNEAQSGVARLIETWHFGKPLLLGTETVKNEDGKEEKRQEKDQGNGLHVIWWNDSQKLYLGHSNYVYFEPGETPIFPYFFAPCYPRENSPFGYGEAHYLKNQQIMLNKVSEIAMEGAALQALGQTYVKEGAVNEQQQQQIDQYGNIPGWWLWVDDPAGIEHIAGKGVPGSLMVDREHRTKVMENIIGRFDITQGKTPGSVTAFRALSLLAERAQVRLRTKEQSIKGCLEDVSRFVSLLIGKFYNEKRVYRIIGDDDKEFVDGTFDPDSDLHRVWIKGTGDVVPKDRFQPGEGQVEDQDYEFFTPDFDSRCSVSRTMPVDRILAIEMAKELLAAKMITPEIFWRVMEQGRFPAWDSVREEMEQAFAGAQAQPLPPRPPEMVMPDGGQGIEQMIAMLSPEQQQELASLPPEQQQMAIAEMAAAMGGGTGGA